MCSLATLSYVLILENWDMYFHWGLAIYADMPSFHKRTGMCFQLMDYSVFCKFVNFASPNTSTRLAIYDTYLVLVNFQTRFINAL